MKKQTWINNSEFVFLDHNIFSIYKEDKQSFHQEARMMETEWEVLFVTTFLLMISQSYPVWTFNNDSTEWQETAETKYCYGFTVNSCGPHQCTINRYLANTFRGVRRQSSWLYDQCNGLSQQSHDQKPIPPVPIRNWWPTPVGDGSVRVLWVFSKHA